MLRPKEKKNLVCPSQLRKFFSLGAFAAAIFFSSALSSLHAAELVMFEQAGCGWCETFDREIAPIYPKTAEGQRAPLRRVSIDHPVPSDLAFIEVERLAPVVCVGSQWAGNRTYPWLSR